jgi:hypothetical protein
MKKYIKNLMLTCAVALSLMACTEDKLDLFDATGKGIVYFQWSVEGFRNNINNKIDSTAVSFAADGPEVIDSIFNIPVKVLGMMSNSDREFKIKVLSTSTAVEGIDFMIPENGIGIVPAQSVTAMVPITLFRTEAMQNAAVSIKIGLEPNEHFNTDYYGTAEREGTNELLKYNEFELAVSDILTKPLLWIYVEAIMGEWSAKKFRLFASVNNMPLPDWNTTLPSPAIFYPQVLNFLAYLKEHRLNGTPVLEADGTEMRLSPGIDPI